MKYLSRVRCLRFPLFFFTFFTCSVNKYIYSVWSLLFYGFEEIFNFLIYSQVAGYVRHIFTRSAQENEQKTQISAIQQISINLKHGLIEIVHVHSFDD